ncbi:MAG: hypothetical protein ACKO7B_05970 [Flavobacteriales bacterium]
MKKLSLIIAFATMCSTALLAGNPDRAGSAGASQLLINPWARNSALANSAMASVNGIEASFLNVAGLAFVKNTELVFSNNQYLVGTGIQINALGLGKRLGESGVLGIILTCGGGI